MNYILSLQSHNRLNNEPNKQTKQKTSTNITHYPTKQLQILNETLNRYASKIKCQVRNRAS